MVLNVHTFGLGTLENVGNLILASKFKLIDLFMYFCTFNLLQAKNYIEWRPLLGWK